VPVTDSAYYKYLPNHCLGNTFLSTKRPLCVLARLHSFEAQQHIISSFRRS